MVTDPWLPVGFLLPDGGRVSRPLFEGAAWQIFETTDGRVLVAKQELADRWVAAGLLPDEALANLSFEGSSLRLLSSQRRHALGPVEGAPSPSSKGEALAFALSLRATRALGATLPLQDCIFVERFSRLLPTWAPAESITDDLLVGRWLTGGANVSTASSKRLSSFLSWLPHDSIREVVEAAGLLAAESFSAHTSPDQERVAPEGGKSAKPPFRLAGRAVLELFFREHVIDIVEHPETYRHLGIEFPSPVVLHGPPGCGKTFAVEKLVEYLDWPVFSLDSSTIGSPYIHDTGRKIAQAFGDAIKAAPAVVVIDEMDAFLSDRQAASQGSHHVEEVAEFLRRIPEVIQNHVLLVGMTNRIEAIDKAILRRGRFDHIIQVDMPSAEEVLSLLEALLSTRPCDGGIDRLSLVARLAGRPLSDVSFVVRESGRIAAKKGRSTIDQACLDEAIAGLPAKLESETTSKPIGFRRE